MPERAPVPDLDEVYDDATLAALDAWGRRGGPAPPPPATASGSGWRRGAATGALVTGLVLGLREVLEDEVDDETVLEMEAPGADPGAAVVVHLVPFDPAASVAVVRPWLLARR